MMITVGVLVALGVAVLVGALASIAFACIYKQKVVDRKPALMSPVHERWRSHGELFASTLCDCFSNPEICIHGCFCFLPRLADTYASSGVQEFWAAFWTAFIVSVLVKGFLEMWLSKLGTVAAQGIFALVFQSKRAALRHRLGGVNTGFNWTDCIYLWCCPSCSICQEARVVDGAMGVHTACCCKLHTSSDTELMGMVGPPVITASILQPAADAQGGPARQPQAVQGALPAAQAYAVDEPRQLMVVGTVVSPDAPLQVELQSQGQAATGSRGPDPGDAYTKMADD